MNTDDLQYDPRTTASEWHSGQSSALYAFSSSGAILPGASDEAAKCVAMLAGGHDPGTGEDLDDLYRAAAELRDYLLSIEQGYVREATERGTADAEAAASWTVDGNTSQGSIRRVLTLMDDGDDIDDYCPRRPDLSGEWADSLTPLALARDIIGEDWADEWVDELSDAYDEAVDETFYAACERNLRAVLRRPAH